MRYARVFGAMRRRVHLCAIALVLIVLAPPARAEQTSTALSGLDALYPSLSELYLDLHRNPELSLFEEKTAAKMADHFKRLGYEVTTKVGGHGVVGVLRNGDGPTVLLRADMDALPLKEQTGVPHASTVTMVNQAGETVPVMHACGHDVHMVSLVGAAALLAQTKSEWRGTLLLIAQPAEEGVTGAKAMIQDRLFERFPKPDYCLGVHVDSRLPAGEIGITPGPTSAASNSVDIVVYGRGGHGSTPQRTIDPIVIGARIVTTLQTIMSREVDPQDAAVVTVGTFHAGTRRNIIPDEAKLELTVRTYEPAVRDKILASIGRIARAEAAAAGAEREPLIDLHPGEGADVVINDPALSERLEKALQAGLGAARIRRSEPLMGSEDFGVFGTAAGSPSIQFRIGAVNPELFADAKSRGRLLLLPGPHSPLFLPEQEPTIRTGVAAFTLAARELLNRAEGQKR